LGDDLKYQVERSGRRYSVIERRFALVPERSGEFSLPPPRFEGTGTDRGGYGGLLGSAGVRLSASGDALTLNVRPRPQGAADPWLPASALSLQLVGEAPPQQVRVGEPLSLGLQLSAQGLLPAQLPELELPAIDGAAVYPDQASSRDRSSAEGLASERFRRFAIVPQRAGELQLPALRVPWWDVQSDRRNWNRIASKCCRRRASLRRRLASAVAPRRRTTPSPQPTPMSRRATKRGAGRRRGCPSGCWPLA
jgi:hypothetical protein